MLLFNYIITYKISTPFRKINYIYFLDYKLIIEMVLVYHRIQITLNKILFSYI